MFPLRLVAFPEEVIHLHIFEPRYLQLINECDSEGITIGIPMVEDGAVYRVGTEMELLEIVNRHADGRMDIRMMGVGRFKGTGQLFTGRNKLYSFMQIERFDGEEESDLVLQEELFGLVVELHKLADVKGKLPPTADLIHSFKVGHYVGLGLVQENELLSLPDEVERLQFLIEHVKMLIPGFKIMQELKERAKMNGHFRVVDSIG